MNTQTTVNISSLIMGSSLVFISLLFSYFQKLKLQKEIIISVLRAIIQLTIVGYVLEFIFGFENPIFITSLLAFMIFNASLNASKRGKDIKNGLLISFISIATGSFVTLAILVISGGIKYQAYLIIPVGGMIISNSMVALGLCYKQISNDFKNKREEVEIKLSLGSDIYEASKEIIKDAIRTGMIPTIDSAKTLGIVSLPGMMTGLILAGTSPILAIRYQILVTFMLISTTGISSFIACYLSYNKFFTKRKQLIIITNKDMS